ncbi:MAG: 4Fe-4S binding protein, partial [Prevotellaceae bacterium]|jgi:ferredoxin|nr:4Fe-4S binding protein [Prevotellaceae bacterium]
VLDIVVLVALLSVVSWATLRHRSRRPIIISSIISVAYFGFLRHGCVCAVGAVQNIALSLADSSYFVPVSVALFFFIPLIFTLFFSRTFCGGVCPFGALQDLVNIRNYRLSRAVTTLLGIIPWLYLILALLFAVTGSGFLICRFDPFVGIFRLGGELSLIITGVLILVLAMFTGRPYCRFLCPYGVLLKLVAKVSIFGVKITRQQCINCDLCRNSCPTDAILPPNENAVKEKRAAGIRRILLYLVTIPAMVALFAFGGYLVSDKLANVNKAVRTAILVERYANLSPEEQPLEVSTFLSQGASVEELSAQAAQIRKQFRTLSAVAGGLMGLVISLTLLGLSVKRGRKIYTVDNSSCVSCGRCFGYCPQNKLKGER